MDADCCDYGHSSDPHRGDPALAPRPLAVLALNAFMFVVEIGAGLMRAALLHKGVNYVRNSAP
jgi:hypothetical protein